VVPQTAARLAAAFGTEAAPASALRESGDAGTSLRGSPAAKKPPAAPRAQPSSPAERAAANKALFEGVKASRNALRAEVAALRLELEATRAELARHCGEALRSTQQQSALQGELALRASMVDELRARLATAEARAELAAATVSPRQHRMSAAAAMEAGAQAAEALRAQVEALQSDLVLEHARSGAAAAAAAAALAESEAARLAAAAERLTAPMPPAGLSPSDAVQEILAAEVATATARCAALEVRNAELETAAAAVAAQSQQMAAELAMAAKMLNAQRVHISGMDASRVASESSAASGPSAPPDLGQAQGGDAAPQPNGAAALLGCTSARGGPVAASADGGEDGEGNGIVASTMKLFDLFG